VRTEVAITIDTEFSVAGAFEDFERYKPIAEQMVDCAVDGKSEGLGFLLPTFELETFEKYDVPATFFVEAAPASTILWMAENALDDRIWAY
jgi:hypothetical protein